MQNIKNSSHSNPKTEDPQPPEPLPPPPRTIFSNFLSKENSKSFKTLSIKVETSQDYSRVSKKAKLCSVDVTRDKIAEIVKLQTSKTIKKKPKKKKRTLKEMIQKMSMRPPPLKAFSQKLDLEGGKFANDADSELGVKSDSNEKRTRVLERDGKKRIQGKIIKRKKMGNMKLRNRSKRRNSFL